MNVTGIVVIDLTVVKEDRRRFRVGALATAPAGATVELVIGPLIVDAAAVRLLREYAQDRQLSVTVKGEHYAVRSWVEALRSGEIFGMLL